MSAKNNLSRRELVKLLAASGGSLVAAAFLPGKWVKPVVATGVLPAHAQSTACLLGDQVSIVATTTTQVNDEYVDFDLYVRTPDSSLVGPETPGPHQGAVHNGDNISQQPPSNSESISIGGPASGVYQIGVRYWLAGAGPDLSITVTIISGECIFTFSRTIVDDSPSDPMHIADITFPAGTVTERSGPFSADRRARSGKKD